MDKGDNKNDTKKEEETKQSGQVSMLRFFYSMAIMFLSRGVI
jgi:hypothetical protein